MNNSYSYFDHLIESPSRAVCPKCGKVYDDSWEVCLQCSENLVSGNLVGKERIRQEKSDQKSEKEKAGEDICLKLEKLAKLKDKGIITQEEYSDKKKSLLDAM